MRRNRVSCRQRPVRPGLRSSDEPLAVVSREEVGAGLVVVEAGLERRDEVTCAGEVHPLPRRLVEIEERARDERMVVQVGIPLGPSPGPPVE